MRALFTSKNLIGDGLYIQPALKAWLVEHPGWEIDLLTLPDHISCLYEGMGIPNLRVIHEREGYIRAGEEDQPCVEYDFEHIFDVNKAFARGDQERIHIAEAYARELGVKIEVPPPKVEYTPSDGDNKKGLILFSMFSNSCASRQGKPPNKMISWGIWMAALTYARQLGPIGLLGGPNDKAELLDTTPDEMFLARPLPEVARMMRDAKLLITIDNGMGHLAASQGTPTILFYPNCLGQHWIVPSGNHKLVVHQMDPMRLTVLDGMMIIREGVKRLWEDSDGQ